MDELKNESVSDHYDVDDFDDFKSLNPNMERLQKQLKQQQRMNEAVQFAMAESCVTKTMFAGAAGGAFGGMWALFTSAMGPGFAGGNFRIEF